MKHFNPLGAQRAFAGDTSENSNGWATRHYTIRPRHILLGHAPPSSYWVGASREQLAQTIAQRKPLQACPTTLDAAFDPSLAATLSWMERKAAHRLLKRRRAA